jgi:hypothetical protein
MRFDRNRYYIEEYIKCTCCGELIYDRSKHPPRGSKEQIFCSKWCRNWFATRDERSKFPLGSSEAAALGGEPEMSTRDG